MLGNQADRDSGEGDCRAHGSVPGRDLVSSNSEFISWISRLYNEYAINFDFWLNIFFTTHITFLLIIVKFSLFWIRVLI